MDIDKSSVKKVLVRAPNWLGDAIMALPAIKAASEIFRPETLSILAPESLESLFARYDFIDNVVPFSRQGEGAVHGRLPGDGYDAIVYFTNSFRSAWNGMKTCSKIRIGYAGNFRSFLLSHKAERDDSLHMTDFYLQLLKVIDSREFPKDIDFPLLENEESYAAKIENSDGGIGIPLGAKYGSAKEWPEENLGEFISLVMEKTEKSVVLFGTGAEMDKAEKLRMANPERIVNLAGKTSIGEMAAVMAKCSAVVANDSGPLHLASALGAKVVALFGSTSPERTAPRSPNVIVLKGDADCAPCYKRECPTDFRCMKGISAESVFKVLQDRQ